MSKVPRFTVERLASPTETLSRYDLPRWNSQINEHWLSKRRGSVFLLRLHHHHDTEEWVALGKYLVESLILPADFVGICLEGMYPETAVALSWAERLTKPGKDTLRVVTLHWANEPWPPGTDGHAVLNICLCVLQTAGDASWIRDLWRELDYSIFHYPADLVISGYRARMGETVWRDTPLTYTHFARSLEQASAWMKAGDGWGYVVGLTEGSKPYERVMSVSWGHE